MDVRAHTPLSQVNSLHIHCNGGEDRECNREHKCYAERHHPNLNRKRFIDAVSNLAGNPKSPKPSKPL